MEVFDGGVTQYGSLSVVAEKEQIAGTFLCHSGTQSAEVQASLTTNTRQEGGSERSERERERARDRWISWQDDNTSLKTVFPPQSGENSDTSEPLSRI